MSSSISSSTPAEPINSVSVETADGYKTFNLVHGDVTAVHTDLLVLSAYGSGRRAPEGEVVKALYEKHGVVVAPEPRWLNFSNHSWTSFQKPEGDLPFSALLTVFIQQLAWGPDPLPLFKKAVHGVFASLAALEYMDHSFPIVSLPVLYGKRIHSEHSQGVEYYPHLIEILIRHGLQWLKKSNHTSTIQFVVYKEDELAVWNDAMNVCMGRSIIAAGTDKVIQGLCQEIRKQATERQNAQLQGSLEPLAEALKHEEMLNAQSICIFGRKMAEEMLQILMLPLGIKPQRELANNIEALRKSKRVAPWITSYMDSLRVFGNEEVHVKAQSPGYRPTRLDKGDLVSALSAIRALLSSWPDIKNGQQIDDTTTGK